MGGHAWSRHQLGPVGPPSYHTLSLRIAWHRVLSASQKTTFSRMLPLAERMAKHTGKGRRRGKVLKGRISLAVTLGTLANAAAVATAVGDTVQERTLALSIEVTASLRSATPGEGPLVVGVAHSDYSAAEIEEWIENAGSWDEGDLVNQEIARRKIRQIGVFDSALSTENLAEGQSIKIALKWILTQTQTLDFWVYNRSGATLTTGTLVNFDGHCWLKPQ